MTDPFAPGTTVSLTASTTSASKEVSGSTHKHMLRVFNSGTVTAFIKTGDSTVTATANDLPMPGGIVEVISIGSDTYCAAITASGSSKLYLTIGIGI